MDAKNIIISLSNKGIKQTEIAAATGLSQASISLIKNGKRTAVKHTTHVKLINLLKKKGEKND